MCTKVCRQVCHEKCVVNMTHFRKRYPTCPKPVRDPLKKPYMVSSPDLEPSNPAISDRCNAGPTFWNCGAQYQLPSIRLRLWTQNQYPRWIYFLKIWFSLHKSKSYDDFQTKSRFFEKVEIFEIFWEFCRFSTFFNIVLIFFNATFYYEIVCFFVCIIKLSIWVV